VDWYEGDARTIWENQSINDTLSRLIFLRVGDQISRMVVGALKDTNQIHGKGDVKVDIHVRRVLGRVFNGKEFPASSVNEVIDKTREMYPSDPWQLDRSLFLLGRDICKAKSLNCEYCYLHDECCYYSQQRRSR